MRTQYLLTAILFLLYFGADAQSGNDRFYTSFNTSFSVVPIQVLSTANTANSYDYPVYKYSDTTGTLAKMCIYFGANIPVIRKDKWSIGAKFNVGVGQQRSIRAADGLTSNLLELPQYIYYRNYTSNFDYSILAGIKQTRTGLNYTLPMVAFEINMDKSSLQFYSSVKRYTYYAYYTNGTEKPFLKIGDHGILLAYKIGNKN